MTPRRLITFLALIFAVLAGTAAAQNISGTITGSIADPSGAAVPGATIKLANEDTGDSRVERSTSDGNFEFTAVLPGSYTLGIEAAGFKRVEKKNLHLTATERLFAGKFALELGPNTESVTVTAEGATVQNESYERSTVLTNSQIEVLPSMDRNIVSMLQVLPGVVDTGNNIDQGQRGSTPFVNGISFKFNSVNYDGLASMYSTNPEANATYINPDAVAEVRVLLNNYQAEYGRTAGALINEVTKSGTRNFHGSAFTYWRHEQFNADSYFNNLNHVAKPIARYRLYGYTLGGPVYWPRKFNSNRQKLFFFVSEEAHRNSTATSLIEYTMPTALQRAGNFSQTTTVAGVLIPIKDPLNGGAPFPGNIVPTNRINPATQALLNLLPMPNFSNTAVSKNNYNFVTQWVQPEPKDEVLAKVDYNISDNLRLYWRGNMWRDDTQGYSYGAGPANWGMIKGDYLTKDLSAVLNLTYTLNSTTVNELTLGAVRWREGVQPGELSASDLARFSRTQSGATLPQLYPGDNPRDLVPQASFGGVTDAPSFTYDQRFPDRGQDTHWNIADGLTKVIGRHTAKAGIYIETDGTFKGDYGNFAGTYSFAQDVNNPNDSNYAYSNALLGNFDSYTEATARVPWSTRFAQVEWYLQDNWKATRRLTLDYGMRFSYAIPAHAVGGLEASYEPQLWSQAQAPVLFRPTLNAAGQRVAINPLTGVLEPAVFIGGIVPGSGNTANGMVEGTNPNFPQGLVKNQGVLPAPRMGFAYDVFGDGKMAIRGGFGINYFTAGNLVNNFVTNPPLEYSPTIYYGNVNTLLQTSGITFPGAVSGKALSGEVATSYNFSLGVQRNIGYGTVLDVAYVGTQGRHLWADQNLGEEPYGGDFLPQNIDPTNGKPLPTQFLRPDVGYTDITDYETGATSNYNSLQMQANRRFTKGLQFGVSWTWSKAMDYGNGTTSCCTGIAILPTYLNAKTWNYALGAEDRTHNLVINYLYEIPKASRLWNVKPVRWAFDNWQWSGFTSFISGIPTSVSYSTTDGADITGGGDGSRVVMLCNPNLAWGNRAPNRFFNTSCFGRPPQGTIGNAPRVVVRGPGIDNFNAIFYKSVFVREPLRVQLRWEMYNALNHTQFSAMNTSAQFNPAGQQVNALFGTVTAAYNPRVMQFALRFAF